MAVEASSYHRGVIAEYCAEDSWELQVIAAAWLKDANIQNQPRGGGKELAVSIK